MEKNCLREELERLTFFLGRLPWGNPEREKILKRIEQLNSEYKSCVELKPEN
jgi:hypothetical protein